MFVAQASSDSRRRLSGLPGFLKTATKTHTGDGRKKMEEKRRKKRDVIPNQAEGPVRNLLFPLVDQTHPSGAFDFDLDLRVQVPIAVIPTGAAAHATAKWWNLLFAPGRTQPGSVRASLAR
jgi:hypothetical protein